MTLRIPDLHLRPFRLNDADAIEPWLEGAGLAVPGGVARREWPVRILADQRIVMKIAESHGRRVGLVRLDCGPDLVAEITVVVAPGERRKGLGRAMFEAALALARELGLRRIVASIDHGNDVAQDFFADMGFDHQGLNGSRVLFSRPVHRARGQAPLEIDV